MHIMVTGGAGFIGSNIIRRLIRDGHRVRVLDNLSTGFYKNIEEVENKIEFLKGDLRDMEFLSKALENVDYVLHQAAVPSVPRSIKDPQTSNESNVTGTLNLLVAARDNNIKRVVLASSSSVYGDTPILPKQEDMTPNPLSPYALTKLAGEHYARIFYQVYGLETVCLRYFNVFGPRQNPDSQYSAVIPKFIKMINRGETPVIYGDGEQSRDFTFVENVIDANIKAMAAPDAPGKVFNIACNERYTLNNLVSIINEILDKNISACHEETRKGDIKHSLADISRARSVLGYNPSFTFKDGLKITAQWYAG